MLSDQQERTSTMQQTHAPHDTTDPQPSDAALEENPDREHAFLSNLVRELFQTEQSAKTHPLVEAERLGDIPPAHALRAVSAHAEVVLAELPSLMRARSLPVSAGGRATGKMFSVVRDHFADVMLSTEKSYRGTLLGMHHGIDLVELIHHVAIADGDPELALWCARWLDTRKPLVEDAIRATAWFAAHPTRATEASKDTPIANALQAVVNGLENMAGRLRRSGSADARDKRRDAAS
jgi:hypothetical protein